MKKLGQQGCASCSEMRRCRHRDFSSHAWAVLLHWEEISATVVGRPLCNSCYNDLRELLIERSAEVEAIISEGSAEHEQKIIAEALATQGAAQQEAQMVI